MRCCGGRVAAWRVWRWTERRPPESLGLARVLTDSDGDDVAERLHLRDAHADFRHLCVECRRYRCSNHLAADLHSPEVAHALAVTFQHCGGLQP